MLVLRLGNMALSQSDQESHSGGTAGREENQAATDDFYFARVDASPFGDFSLSKLSIRPLFRIGMDALSVGFFVEMEDLLERHIG